MKIICIGRNYADHAKELNNPVPVGQPVVFMKSPNAMLTGNKPFYYPEFTKDLHHEIEVVLKICKNGKAVQPAYAWSYFEEITLGIDFTARDVQDELKKKGHPWEIAKSFDNSAAVGKFIPLADVKTEGNIEFFLRKNGQVAQHGNTRDVLFSFEQIIVYVSQFFKLQQGDLIFTGTPAGVGPVKIGDHLEGVIMTNAGTEERLLECQVK